MRITIAASFFGLALSLLSCGTTYASDPTILAKYYGSGVHSYFGGSFAEAHDELSAAIKAGTDDPRTFYFRGLALLNMGRADEATADFKRGAELEAGDLSGFYQVGPSLKRVQGANRLTLEKYRNTARVILQQSETNRRRERYETGRRNEDAVLRKIPSGPESAAGVNVTRPNQSDAPSIGVDAVPAAPAGTTTPKAAELDPFGNPIGGTAPAAKTPAPKATTPPAEADNLFGDPAPVATPPAVKPAAATPPAPKAATPPAEADNLFGDPAPVATPPAVKPAAKTPPAPAAVTPPKPATTEPDLFGSDPTPGPPAKEPIPGERPNRAFEKETVPGERPNRVLGKEPIPGESTEPQKSTSPAKSPSPMKVVDPPPAIEPKIGSPAPTTPKLGDAPKPAEPAPAEPNLFETTPAAPTTPAPAVTPPATPVTPPAAEPNAFETPAATPTAPATPPAPVTPPATTPATPVPATPAPMPTPEPVDPFKM